MRATSCRSPVTTSTARHERAGARRRRSPRSRPARRPRAPARAPRPATPSARAATARAGERRAAARRRRASAAVLPALARPAGEERQAGPEQVERRHAARRRRAPRRARCARRGRRRCRRPAPLSRAVGIGGALDVVLRDGPALALVAVQQRRIGPAAQHPRQPPAEVEPSWIAVFRPVPPRGDTRCAASPTRNARSCAEARRRAARRTDTAPIRSIAQRQVGHAGRRAG